MTTTTAGAYQIHTGDKYDSKLRIRDIPALVRADLKAAIAAGTLPKGLKTSVTKKALTLGYGITIAVKALPPGSPDYFTNLKARADHAELDEALKQILTAYQRSEDDAHTGGDYRNANFMAAVIWEVAKR